MRAAAELARSPVVNDTAFAETCDAALAAGRAALDAHLWSAEAGYYRSYTGGEAVHADALYAQVLADSLGLGALGGSDDKVGVLRREHATCGMRERAARGVPCHAT